MIKPSDNFLLVDRIVPKSEREEKTSAGIVIARPKENRDDLAVQRGKVLAVGKGVDYKTGQIVLYNYFAGNTIVVEGNDPLGKDDKEQHLVWKDDILAVEE